MATASATLSPATFTAAASISSPRRTTARKVHYLTGMNSFAGLKASNGVVSLGLPVCAEQSFEKIMMSFRAPSKGRSRGWGALSSSCNAVGEIFRIAAIMNGLVLVGVAVGFVLLRIEASLEESES
ncbi:PetM of cytochrome b6/f complex subunit [Parasponia andersonii]|uniref:PetM of cytochrome b6/f complex subunit n=1 Tax=Parasponia andersonii TaxID=3476 RepID=A0A2P5C7J6_PARAD|nr:PetM of cytochrome b6/f complex subunit [Parasponia andersonii]